MKGFFLKIKEAILKPFRWLETGMPVKGKIIIALLLLLILGGAGFGSYQFYDFTQNNPNFCVSCHLMKEAFDAWQASEHSKINCHECHHLSIPEANRLLINFVLHRPTAVPDRHGKIIVPWDLCIKCHWEKDKRFPDAPMINTSNLHAKHVFKERQECSKCHGYIVHKFVPEERFCLQCHDGKVVHGAGMTELACLHCHTDRTRDLKPGRKKCLFCHGTDEVRKELVADASIDVKRYEPTKQTIAKAIKVSIPQDAPMQFFCYECHKPHKTVRPDWGHCLDCHKQIPGVGKHTVHIQVAGMQCKDCHRPHSWRVTPESAKKDCVKCHEYRDPKRFISG